MPRSSYYVDPGNPQQLSLLPKRLMSLEFLCTRNSVEPFSEMMNVLKYLLVYDIGTLIATTVFRFHTTTPILVGTLIYIVIDAYRALKNGSYRQLVTVLLFTAVGVSLSLMSKGNPAVVLPWMGAMLGWCVYQFGNHWIYRCTPSPMPRTLAREHRSRWRPAILLLAAFPFLAAVLASLFQSPWLFAGLLYGLCFIQLSLYLSAGGTFGAARHSFTSWLTYNAGEITMPGLLQSPAGPAHGRRVLLVGCAIGFAVQFHLINTFSNDMIFNRYAEVESPLLLFIFPALTFACLPVLLLLPCILDASRTLQEAKASPWRPLIEELRASANPLERDAYYQGRVLIDGCPLLLDRSIFKEHGHFLGPTGSGKTSQGLNPWIEQTIGFGDSSILVLDLKADSLETLSTMKAAAEQRRRTHGQEIPLKVFSMDETKAMHAYNPLASPIWAKLKRYKRTDFLIAGLGLDHGPGYGRDHFTIQSKIILTKVFELFPNCASFRELAQHCRDVAEGTVKTSLTSDVKKNAVDLAHKLQEFAEIDQLQVHPGGIFPQDVVDGSIELADLFRSPQLQYFHLSSIDSAGVAPMLARFVTAKLLMTAARVERRTQVYLVIDEFQRMAAQSLEYLLQLSRSLGIGVILSNQSMEDLNLPGSRLVSSIESNCRYRQWFGVTSVEDRKRIKELAGETVELFKTETDAIASDGKSTSSVAWSETVVPRINGNEISRTSARQNTSLVHLTMDAGYAQFGGLPFTLYHDFHISFDEYLRRQNMPWPSDEPGMFVVDDLQNQLTTPVIPASGPTIIRDDAVGDEDAVELDLDELFRGLNPDTPNPKKKRKRKTDGPTEEEQ